jgi:hypothetical protein
MARSTGARSQRRTRLACLRSLRSVDDERGHEGVKLERTGHDAFAVRVSAVELSTLIAAVRLAVDVLGGDDQAPPEAVARLRALLGDYERAAARLRRPGGQPQGLPPDSPDPASA